MTRRQRTHCQRGHPFDEKNTHLYRDKTGRLKRVCRSCAKSRNPFRKRLYGLSAEDYKDLLADQNNACAICGRNSDDRALSVDHDHASGSVRGLLCSPCNTGLGVFRDDPRLLTKAIAYLETFARGQDVLGSEPAVLTAADADQLAVGFEILFEAFTDDIEQLAAGEDFVSTAMWTYLPDLYRERYDLRFALGFLLATSRTRDHWLQGAPYPATCVAEELALSAAIKTAVADARAAGTEGVAERLQTFAERVLPDRDLLPLWEPGVGLSREQARIYGVTHLWFNAWFRPFSAPSSRDKAALN